VYFPKCLPSRWEGWEVGHRQPPTSVPRWGLRHCGHRERSPQQTAHSMVNRLPHCFCGSFSIPSGHISYPQNPVPRESLQQTFRWLIQNSALGKPSSFVRVAGKIPGKKASWSKGWRGMGESWTWNQGYLNFLTSYQVTPNAKTVGRLPKHRIKPSSLQSS
jgi:hypothetical protein